MVHRAKVDILLLMLPAAGILVPLVMALYHLFAPGADTRHGWRLLVLGLFIAAIVFCLGCPINYEVRRDDLVLRSGVVRWSIPLSSIVEVKPLHGLKLGYTVAPSLGRMQVNYLKNGARNTVLISPKDQDAFLQDMASKSPGLVKEGDGLARHSQGN